MAREVYSRAAECKATIVGAHARVWGILVRDMTMATSMPWFHAMAQGCSGEIQCDRRNTPRHATLAHSLRQDTWL